jgi:2-keto-4-pentenoate hydratase/2-oxohepta-3-ene-1,7-dioic acid hydratase in catechol pathway
VSIPPGPIRYARMRIPDGARYAVARGSTALLLEAAPWLGGKPSGVALGLDSSLFACPVTPTKILCVGRNYAAHAAELGNAVPRLPLWFMKPPSALIGPDGRVILPPESQRVEHEGELGVVIGRRARRVPEAKALEHVFGYTIACDVTARDLQKNDGQWTRAKGFDTFCPVGPFVVSGVDPSNLRIRVSVGGQLRQDASTAQMVFGIAQLVSHASSIMTLEPGDLILTGTPEGVGPLAPGDRVRIEIEQLGALEFDVARE